MPAADASQCVDATIPKVPRSSGRVVNSTTDRILGAPTMAPLAQAGSMFWFTWKTLSGSYLPLISASRS